MLRKGDCIAVEYDVDGKTLLWDATITGRTDRSAFLLKFDTYNEQVRSDRQAPAPLAP